jgi:nicotinate-nucleotide pyrophosphorylase (carboxylating)
MIVPSSLLTLPRLPKFLIDRAVEMALSEDLGLAGDLTTDATVPEGAVIEAYISSRKRGVISGLPIAEATFAALDPQIEFTKMIRDGDRVVPGDPVARIAGNARAILSAERVALNFLGRLSGIATLTRAYVDAIAGTSASIVDTRKTTPGLRAFEKYAVVCGGGRNHRSGLFDAILIKDNHIAAAGGTVEAIKAARARAGHMVKIEIEVDTLDQLKEVLPLEPDAVLLDNMTTAELREAVDLASGKTLLEASGRIGLETVRVVAETGVDLISVGALTHSANVLDLGLDFHGTKSLR